MTKRANKNVEKLLNKSIHKESYRVGISPHGDVESEPCEKFLGFLLLVYEG